MEKHTEMILPRNLVFASTFIDNVLLEGEATCFCENRYVVRNWLVGCFSIAMMKISFRFTKELNFVTESMLP